MNITPQTLQQIERFALDVISQPVAPAPGRDETLQLTGLEILAFIAVKAALPVVTAFVARGLYDKWTDVGSKKQAAELREALLKSETAGAATVDLDEVIAATTRRLVDEGFPSEWAADAARKIVERTGALLG